MSFSKHEGSSLHRLVLAVALLTGCASGSDDGDTASSVEQQTGGAGGGPSSGGSSATGAPTGGMSSSTAGAGAIGGTSGGSVASGGMSAAGLGGNAGNPIVPNEELDPELEFPWPQTEPSTDPRCEPGTYTGTWSCLAFETLPFEGNVSFQFERSEDGEFLELVDAMLDGEWSETYSFVSGLQGRLSCATLEFTADAVDGVWTPIGGFEGILAAGAFTGTLVGTLDPTESKISGEWHLVSDVFIDCKGPWSAELQP